MPLGRAIEANSPPKLHRPGRKTIAICQRETLGAGILGLDPGAADVEHLYESIPCAECAVSISWTPLYDGGYVRDWTIVEQRKGYADAAGSWEGAGKGGERESNSGWGVSMVVGE